MKNSILTDEELDGVAGGIRRFVSEAPSQEYVDAMRKAEAELIHKQKLETMGAAASIVGSTLGGVAQIAGAFSPAGKTAKAAAAVTEAAGGAAEADTADTASAAKE